MSAKGSGQAEVMFNAANQFIEQLHLPQKDLREGREYALFPFDHRERETFDYFAPTSRFYRGLPRGFMNSEQDSALKGLLQASLSEKGYHKVEQICSLEKVLNAIEENDKWRFVRDAGAYYVTIFGTFGPGGLLSRNSPWGWRFQGHHISLNWTILDGVVVSSTPQFIGAQPMNISEKYKSLVYGWPPEAHELRVLSGEESIARELIQSLDSDQLAVARSGVQFDVPGGNAENALDQCQSSPFDRRGIAYKTRPEEGICLKEENNEGIRQRELLKTLVMEHSKVQHPWVAEQRLAKIEADGWDDVKFFIMGETEVDRQLQYRIRDYRQIGRTRSFKSTFEIDYVNKAFSPAEALANHQHSVWRDFEGDWGRGILSSGRGG